MRVHGVPGIGDAGGMSVAPSSRLPTVDEFLELEDSVAYELFEGELRERHVSIRSSEVGVLLAASLLMYTRARQLGKVWGADLGLQIFPGRPRRVPRADVVFVSNERLISISGDPGFLPVPPDLVAEVISPGNSAGEVDAKVTEYLDAGVTLIWVLHPQTRHVHVFRSGGTVSVLSAEGMLSGEDVIPGFEFPVAALFEA